MELWRFILEADRSADLTAQRAEKWLAAHYRLLHVLPVRGGTDRREPRQPIVECWGRAHQELFVFTVRTLRSLARRLKKFKARSPAADSIGRDIAADEELQKVVRDHIWLRIVRNGRPGGVPLTAATFAGLRAEVEDPRLPTDQPEVVGDPQDRLSKLQGLFDDVAPHLWCAALVCLEELLRLHVEALASLVTADILPVCSKCAIPLGLTPKGRRPRAGMCGRCKQAAWRQRQGKKVMRDKWKKQQSAKRMRDRAESQASKSGKRTTGRA